MNAPCPYCKTSFPYDHRYFGLRVVCRVCGDTFQLPSRADHVLKSWLGIVAGIAAIPLVVWGFTELHRRAGDPNDAKKLAMLDALKSNGQNSVVKSVTPPAADAEEQAAARLKQARELLAQGKTGPAREVLVEITEKYPKTRSAGEAQMLLEKLNKTLAQAG